MIFVMFDTIAVYGGGGIGKRHVRLLRGKFPSSKIILVSQHSKPSEVLHTDIVLNNSDDLGELRPDFTFIANPASLHIDTALQVSEYCSSIFIEKPLSNSLHGIKVLEKNGFSLEGTRINHLYYGGKYYNKINYGLLLSKL